MGQNLNHGVYLPAEGERNCYSGLASNWNLLDTAIGDIAGKASATHTHGDITNDGKVGTAANKPLITGTGGAVQAGSFGNAANTFCEGNDSRLSDARTPVAHTHGKADVTDLFNSANEWGAIQTISYAGSNIAIALKHQETDIAASPTRNNWHYINFYDKNSVALGGFDYSKRTNGNSRVYLNLRTKNTNNDIVEKNVFFETNQEGTDWNLYPASNADINLGTSTNKWKSLNGVNPGGLSLPDKPGGSGTVNVNYFDLSGNVTVKDGSTYNSYTALCDGWIVIGSFASEISIEDDTTNLATTAVPKSNGYAQAYLPVRQGDTVRITINQTNTQYQNFKLIPCQGNV